MEIRGFSKVKVWIHEILETTGRRNTLRIIIDIFLVSLIIINLTAVILETVKSLSDKYSDIFRILEIISVITFTIEYVLRMWTCTVNERYKHPILGRLRFAFTPLALVDLIAILPFYLPMIETFDARFLRILRLLRIFRMFKMARYFESLRILGSILRAKKEELIINTFIIAILLILASSFMYFIENTVQPEAFSSIPQAMWWGVETLTTLGYGDIYPITPIGKALGAIVALLGVGMIALPAGIIASGFSEEIRKKSSVIIVCPNCGKPIED
jgi:voltage-gated potassium channel